MARGSSAPRVDPLTLRRFFPVLDSTQRFAVAEARAGAPDGTVVVAERQEAGRGRLDRGWSSPPGGLYVSVLLREPKAAPLLLPLALGGAVAEALERYTTAPRLKWPNDLVVPDSPRPLRKLAGILVDRVPSPTLGPVMVAGLGLNVRSPPESYPPELCERVVQLSELAGRPLDVGEVEERVVPALLTASSKLDTPEGAARALEGCRGRLYGWGRPARLDGRPAGVIESLDADGSLVLREGGARTRVVAGELAVEEA